MKMEFNLNEEETNRLHVYNYLIKDGYIFFYDTDEDTYIVAKLLTNEWRINLNVENRDL